MLQPLWKTVSQFLIKLNLLCDKAILLLDMKPKKKKEENLSDPPKPFQESRNFFIIEKQ